MTKNCKTINSVEQVNAILWLRLTWNEINFIMPNQAIFSTELRKINTPQVNESQINSYVTCIDTCRLIANFSAEGDSYVSELSLRNRSERYNLEMTQLGWNILSTKADDILGGLHG